MVRLVVVSTSGTAEPAVATRREIEAETEAPRQAETFTDFYRRNHRSVLGIVYTLSGSASAAEELTQDAFAKAQGRWEELAEHANREAWVKRVAINLARSWSRRRMAELKVLARLSRERPVIEPMPESAEHLWAKVRALPANQAAAIALRYHDDRSIDDIASVLGCSAATVRVHLHRGRKTLAKQLGLEFEEGSDED